jgi:redox-sensitive bicupin YhaK (pirin superfamily)
MKKDTHFTLLISILGVLLTALLGAVGWIALQVWDMHPKVTETERRVDRIVDALPEVKTRIIQEDTHKRIQIALLAGDSKETSPGHWSKTIEVLDYATGKSQTFSLPVKNENDQTATYIVEGVVSSISKDNYSFDEWSAATGENQYSEPNEWNIDPSASFTIFKASATYEARLTSAFGQPITEDKIEKKVVRYPQLAEDLRKRGPLKPSPAN